MMRLRLTRWLILCMMAWLPLSGALAAAMPIAALAATVATSVAATEMASADVPSDASIMPCHQVATDGSLNCTHCLLCHIAGAILPPTLPIIAAAPHHDCPQSIDAIAFTSFIPALPQRPPARLHV